MSFELTKWAIQEVQIPQTCKAVLVAICSYCDANSQGFPSQELIARCAGVDPKTASRTIAKLAKMGLISVLKKGFYQVNKVSPIITQGDPQSPKVTENHLSEGDGESPKRDFKSPKRDGESPPYNKPTNKTINKQDAPQNRFEEFWNKYPSSRREGKEKTRTAYRVVCEKLNEDDLFKALDMQIAEWGKNKTEERFKKYILRWLRDGAFERFIPKQKEIIQPKETLSDFIARIDACRASWTREHTLQYQTTEAKARLLINEKKREMA
jgi:hypothetical protein